MRSVLGVGGIVQNARAGLKDHLAVALEQLAERGFVARAGEMSEEVTVVAARSGGGGTVREIGALPVCVVGSDSLSTSPASAS